MLFLLKKNILSTEANSYAKGQQTKPDDDDGNPQNETKYKKLTESIKILKL